MTFWGKNNVIVPLDTLINKEKENTSRPVAARSCGSVGRWGKMGFTSTRTYALKVPAHLSPATGQSAEEIGLSPSGVNSTSIGPGSSPPHVEAPKPKKFFKSRNTTAPLDFIRSQFMQHHMSHISPVTPGYTLHVTDSVTTSQQSIGKDGVIVSLKNKVSKTKKRRESKERLKDKEDNSTINSKDNSIKKEKKERKKSTSSLDKPIKSPKPIKKKKEEKLLKPEAPPSRVLGRNRKAINYNEDDDTIPYRPSEVPASNKKVINKTKSEDSNEDIENDQISATAKDTKLKNANVKSDKKKSNNKNIISTTAANIKLDNLENEDSKSVTGNKNNINNITEHPPIVLRISKGTSRLISTDSEDGKLPSTTPTYEANINENVATETNNKADIMQDKLQEIIETKISSTEELLSVLSDDKPEIPIITKKTRKSSITPIPTETTNSNSSPMANSTITIKNISSTITTETVLSKPKTVPIPPLLPPSEEKSEPPAPIIYPADTIPDINYDSKISPDKPPKERLKLIIKTDVLRKALAAEAEKAEKKKEKEKNRKHKHHHHHHHHHKSLTLKISNTDAQFKTPSPQPAVTNESNCDLYKQLTINSPSERDFDSQSSILGSVSSKATTAIGQFPTANVPDESCVIRSRGSSDITSDLETSQHSSLVAPPSDIESRLESMMDAEDDQTTTNTANGKKNSIIKLKLIEQEPLKEDILEILSDGIEKENISIKVQENLVDNNNKINVKTKVSIKKEKNPIPVSKRPTRNRKNVQENISEISTLEAEMGSVISPSQNLSNNSEEISESSDSPTKTPGRSLRIRGNNAASIIVEDQTLKSPIRKAIKSTKKLEQIPSETESVTTPATGRNTRTSRAQKAKLCETDVTEPIANTVEKKITDKKNKRGVAVQVKEQQDNSENIQTEENETLKIEVQATRSSKRNLKSDKLSSPTLSLTKVISPPKLDQEDTTIPNRKGRPAKKTTLNNLKTNSENQENESTLIDADNNPAEPIVTVPNVRSYGSRKRKPQTDVILSDITPPPTTKPTPVVSIDLPQSEVATIDNDVQSVDEDATPNVAGDSSDKDVISETNSMTTEISQSPIKEYKVNKFKRAWYERDSKTNLENEKPLDNTLEQNDFEDGEPLVKRSIINLATTFNNIHDKTMSNASNKIVNNNTEINNVISLNPAETVIEGGNSNGNLDEKQIKLVISKKKGSIFKSRALVAEHGGIISQEKKRHTYIHKWDAKDEQEALANAAAAKNKAPVEKPPNVAVEKTNTMDYDEEDDQPLALSTRKKPPIRQIITNTANNKIYDSMELAPGQTKVDKNTKEYYTVIRNVKTAHQIQEIGEYQEMDDDVEYILDALQPRNPSSTRCLSALQLATKCMTPAFRMHVRAHGTVTKFFKALQDAKTDKSLGLCTAAIMFILSQDTLNMDLDRDSLELMMNLLESDSADSADTANYERNKQKVRELCEEIKSHGKGTHLNIDSLSAGTLAMETLLSLTSKRAGEWFKEELRELGGLEHIIKTICDCCYQISDYVVSWTDILLEKLKTIERCLRVLENVSLLNEVNQTYILKYGNGHAVNTLFKLYKLCDSEIALYPTTDATTKDNPGVVLREALVPTLKVLINLTHPFNEKALGSSILGQRKGIFDTSFHILLQAPNYVPERCIFELSILVLLLLINLTMHTLSNRQLIMQSHAACDFGNQFDKQPAIKALIEYFYRCEEQAKQAEKNTDAILENPLEKKKAQSQEEFDETVTKLLQKAGHHMEHTLQASYAGILIGYLISDNKENEDIIRSYLRDSSFDDIIKILEKYYNFMNLTASSEATVVSHIKSTKILIDYYQKCESHSTTENEQQIKNANNFNLVKKEIDLNETASSTTTTTTTDGDITLSSHIEPTPSTSVSTRNNIRIYKTYSQR